MRPEPTTPHYDLSFFGWDAFTRYGCNRIITLRSPSSGEFKAFGLPAHLSSKTAINASRARGFIVEGIVRIKKPWSADDVKCLITWVM